MYRTQSLQYSNWYNKNFLVHCRCIAVRSPGYKFFHASLKIANQRQHPSPNLTGCLSDGRSSIKPVIEAIFTLPGLLGNCFGSVQIEEHIFDPLCQSTGSASRKAGHSLGNITMSSTTVDSRQCCQTIKEKSPHPTSKFAGSSKA